MCGIGTDPGIYKPLRPSQIMRSEKHVSNVMKVLVEDYVNPFGVNIDIDNLVSLSSAIPLNDDIATNLLTVPQRGKEYQKKFHEERLIKRNVPFHDPIKRNEIKGFNSMIKKNSSTKKSVDVNRDILAHLLYLSNNKGKIIDFGKALEYPLSTVPLSLCNANGSMRKTNKSKLSQIIMSKSNEEVTDASKENTVYIVDLMALIRVITEIPNTFEDLAIKLISILPKGYLRVDLVADCYFENSIKDAERAKRGTTTKIITNSPKSKVPREFSKFLSNGENKTRMIELIFQTMKEKRLHCLNILRTPQIILSNEQECVSLSLVECVQYPRLHSNHEEADTKVIAHTNQALQVNIVFITRILITR